MIWCMALFVCVCSTIRPTQVCVVHKKATHPHDGHLLPSILGHICVLSSVFFIPAFSRVLSFLYPWVVKSYLVRYLTKYLMTNLPTLEEAQMRQGGTVYDSQDVAA